MKACLWWIVSSLSWIACGPVLACWEEAGARYQINPRVLYAIAKCESDLRPSAVNRSHQVRTGTYDIGLMQINSSHLPRLRAFGIDEAQLYDACTNVHVGAWILADQMARHGRSWEAIGAYNAACTKLKGPVCAAARGTYAWCVYRQLPAADAPASVPAAPSRTPASLSRVAARGAP